MAPPKSRVGEKITIIIQLTTHYDSIIFKQPMVNVSVEQRTHEVNSTAWLNASWLQKDMPYQFTQRQLIASKKHPIVREAAHARSQVACI